MTRNTVVSAALLVLGVGLLVVPALVPIEPIRYHDSRAGTFANESELRAEGFEIVTYENLSDRGQELYVRTLRNGGEYTVALGKGAPDFAYPTDEELGDIEDYRERRTRESIVIERPADDAGLPPPDEQVEEAMDRYEREEERPRSEERPRDVEEERKRTGDPAGQRDGEGDARNTPSREEFRRQVARYDQFRTRTDHPPLMGATAISRLLSVGGGVVALAAGGYLGSKP